MGGGIDRTASMMNAGGDGLMSAAANKPTSMVSPTQRFNHGGAPESTMAYVVLFAFFGILASRLCVLSGLITLSKELFCLLFLCTRSSLTHRACSTGTRGSTLW